MKLNSQKQKGTVTQVRSRLEDDTTEKVTNGWETDKRMEDSH